MLYANETGLVVSNDAASANQQTTVSVCGCLGVRLERDCGCIHIYLMKGLCLICMRLCSVHIICISVCLFMCFEIPVSTFLMSYECNVQLSSVFIAARNCVFVHLQTISRIYELVLSSGLCMRLKCTQQWSFQHIKANALSVRLLAACYV